MTLLSFEGFENRDPLFRAGYSMAGATWTPAFVTGRNGFGYAVRTATGSSSTSYITAQLGDIPTPRTVIASAAVCPRNLAGSTVELIAFRNVADNRHAGVQLSPTGQLTLIGNTSSPTLTADVALTVNEWARVDLVAYCADTTAGWLEVWVNGVLSGRLTGVRTLATTGGSSVNKVAYAVGNHSGSNIRLDVDDVYIADEMGPAPYNGRLGDVRIETLVPSGNGSSSQFTGSDGNSVDNYALVDELPASTTDYVTAAAGNRDLYAFSNLSIASGTVLAVQAHAVAAKTDAGAAFIKPVSKLAAAIRVETSLGLSTIYGSVQGTIQTTDPAGAAWTVANVNAAEFGYDAASS